MNSRERGERRRHLLMLFPEDSGYSELEMDGKVYVKRYDRDRNMWVVAEYTKASFAKYKAYLESRKANQELDDGFKRAIHDPKS